MSEGEYSWTVIDLIVGGGPVHLALHVLAAVLASYVIFQALRARTRHSALPIFRFVLLSFSPLLLASAGVFACLIAIHAIYSVEGLVDPGAVPYNIASARLFLYSGWLWTGLSLIAVRAVSKQGPSFRRTIEQESAS